MKRHVASVIIFGIFAVIAAVFSIEAPGVSAADTVSPAIVGEQCGYAQDYLKTTLKPRDLRARVDRLQAYRYIYQRLDIFVGRLERNNQPGAAELRPLLNDYSKKIDNFKNAYETYDSKRELSATFKNCRNNAESFIKSIDTTRVERQNVHAVIKDLELHLSQSIDNQVNMLYQEQLLLEEVARNKND